MPRIRIASKGWESYTGYLGITQFINGVSVEPVPMVLKNKLAGQLTILEVDEESGEEVQVGIAARIVEERATPAPPRAPLRRATDLELAAESKRIQAESVKGVHTIIRTREELEFIAREKGISGLREIAKPWGVKERSIPGLIREILTAQSDFVERQRQAELARTGEVQTQKAQEPDQTPNGIGEKGEPLFVPPAPGEPAAAPKNDGDDDADKVEEGDQPELPLAETDEAKSAETT